MFAIKLYFLIATIFTIITFGAILLAHKIDDDTLTEYSQKIIDVFSKASLPIKIIMLLLLYIFMPIIVLTSWIEPSEND